MASDDEEALIARLRDVFAETIESQSAAARTRGNIAAKVNSHLSYDEESEDVPASVVPPGKEITGIRRRYLEALKTNIEARERYQLASLGTKNQQSSRLQAQLPPQDIVLSHLELSRLEKRQQELDIHRRYANTFSQDASAVCNLNISPSEQRTGVNGIDGCGEEIAAIVVEVEALTSKLRTTALQANNQLERRKVLLAQAKQIQTSPYSENNRPDGRSRAIAATRDALVAWLDEKLSTNGADQPEEINGPNGRVRRSGSSITDHYQSYLSARKKVIEAGNEAMRPMSRLLPEGPDNAVIPSNEQPPISDNLYLIHAIRQRLVPLMQQRFDSMTLQQYSSAQSTKERKDTLEVLERLANESHLLSTYPADNVDNMDALEQNIAAWISAANASSASAARAIDQQYKEGLQALEKGEEELAELKSYQDNHETLPKKGEGIFWNGIRGNLESTQIS
jgi:hypothetical protein